MVDVNHTSANIHLSDQLVCIPVYRALLCLLKLTVSTTDQLNYIHLFISESHRLSGHHTVPKLFNGCVIDFDHHHTARRTTIPDQSVDK